MWYAILLFILGITLVYIIAINLEKAFYKISSKKQQKKTNTGYVSRKQRMRAYNKKER
jgi:hypothetical protein